MNDPGSLVRARDWIAVDQLLQRWLIEASSDVERAALRLAADRTGGPDPAVPGGGPEWTHALAEAKIALSEAHHDALPYSPPAPTSSQDLTETVQTLVLTCLGETCPDLPFRQANSLSEALSAAVADLLKDHIGRCGTAERSHIADWLDARASRLAEDSVGIAHAQAVAFSDAAAAVRSSLTPTPTDPA